MDNNLILKKYFKWLLLIVVFFLLILNYFALKEIILGCLSELSTILKNFGYYFDIKEPISFIFDLLIPALGLTGFIIKRENAWYILQEIYGKVTFIQLVVLIVILPIFLLLQNRFYSKELTDGTK